MIEIPKPWWERPPVGWTSLFEANKMGELMTKQEKKLVADAAEIISRELKRGAEIRIPNFGAFKLSRVWITLDHPMDDGAAFKQTHVQSKVSFRPFGKLKEGVKNRVKRCRKPAPKLCWHWDGEGHDGPCVNYNQHPLKNPGHA